MKHLLDKANLLRMLAFRAPTEEEAGMYHDEADEAFKQFIREAMTPCSNLTPSQPAPTTDDGRPAN